MANGGAVDARTQMAMQGAMQFERGTATALSAGLPAGVQSAYQQSAANMGALAAENIRNRYFKKEFEQIIETRIDPLNDRLQAAQAAHKEAMQTTVMPVKRTVSAEAVQETMNTLQGPTEVPAPGPAPKAGADGKPAAAPPTQLVPPPNPALSGQQLNAEVTEDQLALFDPVSGQPVPFSSSRGIEIWNTATADFWGEYNNIIQERMQVMSEYVGNPYADNYASNIMEEIIKQSNMATTGSGDPMAAQEYMDKRKTMEADWEIQQQEIGQGRFQVESRDAALQVSSREAAQLSQADEGFADLLGDEITGKLATGQALSKSENLQAASAVRTFRGLQEAKIARQVDSGRFHISSVNLDNPKGWQGEMIAHDKTYKSYYGQEMMDAVNDKVVEVAGLPQNEQAKLLMSWGATEQDVQMYQEGGTMTPGTKAAFDAMVQSGPQVQRANDVAFLRRLDSLVGQQPELIPRMDAVIEDVIRDHPELNAELLRADRNRSFFEITTGRVAPDYHHPDVLKQVAAVDRRQRAEMAEEERVRAELNMPGPQSVQVDPADLARQEIARSRSRQSSTSIQSPLSAAPASPSAPAEEGEDSIFKQAGDSFRNIPVLRKMKKPWEIQRF